MLSSNGQGGGGPIVLSPRQTNRDEAVLMTLVATWWRDGTRAELRDDSDGLWARLELDDNWHPQSSRTPTRAWIVEWLDESSGDPQMVRARLDAEPKPATDEAEMARLSESGADLARGAAPERPAAFGAAGTGMSEREEIRQRVALISHAIQEASARLHEAARCEEEWGAERVVVALTEAVSWIRALDDAMNHVWRSRPEPGFAKVTAAIDQALERPSWNPSFVEWAKGRRVGDEYDDWTLGLVIRSFGLPRHELRGIRWLAGKLLHFGPLPAVELRQWRAGEAPRWKWRTSSDIFPPSGREKRSEDRLAYEKHLAGRDLLGTFNLFDALLATEFLALDLLRA